MSVFEIPMFFGKNNIKTWREIIKKHLHTQWRIRRGSGRTDTAHTHTDVLKEQVAHANPVPLPSAKCRWAFAQIRCMQQAKNRHVFKNKIRRNIPSKNKPKSQELPMKRSISKALSWLLSDKLP